MEFFGVSIIHIKFQQNYQILIDKITDSLEDLSYLIKDCNNKMNGYQRERQLLLKILIDYYAYHLDGFKKPKSLEVLKEVFS